MEKHMARRDKENAQFWQIMEKTLGDSLKEISEKAKELETVRPELSEEDKVFAKEERRRERNARSHPLAKLAWAYSDAVDAWFKKHREDEDLKEANEVVRWYQHFIFVKFMRALQGLEDEKADGEEWDEELRDYPKDYDGSAKIAIIGAERSISAWSRVREKYPEPQATERMIQLAQIRSLAEKTFPDARLFKRPGFDDDSTIE